MRVTDPVAEFRKPEALRINSRRLEHLATLGLNLHGRRVLELGAGIGELTHFWLDRGCSVVSVEPREANAVVYRERYAAESAAEVRVADLDDPPAWDETFDVVFAYGVLYHLSRPLEALRWMAERCGETMVVSTCVALGDEDRIEMEGEHAHCPSQAVSGTGCRPTRAWVVNRLSELFPRAYQTQTQPDHPDFPSDWSEADGSRLTRAVFVGTRV
ncbi:class I SAM-dependent methyltransferase [Mucisphaera calidilacus]|uniref:tRNA (Mo5U34)-methyltransferase n=1 Tax=Mucisphaera calidilacus TaxID=2527982 RepID=A0A518BXD4_9BACT|nr:class I SAM-dependent methyltransferase [Mucisphaera calidilacus]QDU71643.1 tRNA (mo5U34)-methyltransferase [Mucisphaera calidilacus]